MSEVKIIDGQYWVWRSAIGTPVTPIEAACWAEVRALMERVAELESLIRRYLTTADAVTTGDAVAITSCGEPRT